MSLPRKQEFNRLLPRVKAEKLYDEIERIWEFVLRLEPTVGDRAARAERVARRALGDLEKLSPRVERVEDHLNLPHEL